MQIKCNYELFMLKIMYVIREIRVVVDGKREVTLKESVAVL